MCRIARVARWRKRVAPVGDAGGGLLALLQHIGHHLHPGAYGRRRGKDEEVPVAPEKAALAVPVQRIAEGSRKYIHHSANASMVLPRPTSARFSVQPKLCHLPATALVAPSTTSPSVMMSSRL